MENKELYECLENTEKNLELAIKQLEDLSLTSQTLPRSYAIALISRFENASKAEAIDLATSAFYQFSQELKKPEEAPALSSQNNTEKLTEGVQRLILDNTTLKRAVVKLKDKADKAEAMESENSQLKNEIQQLNLTNYMLRMHLQNAMEGKRPLEKEKDIF